MLAKVGIEHLGTKYDTRVGWGGESGKDAEVWFVAR